MQARVTALISLLGVVSPEHMAVLVKADGLTAALSDVDYARFLTRASTLFAALGATDANMKASVLASGGLTASLKLGDVDYARFLARADTLFAALGATNVTMKALLIASGSLKAAL